MLQTKSLSPMTLCLWPQRTIDCCLPCHSHLSMKACYVIVSYKFSEYYITELMFIVEAPGIIDCYAISAISIVAFLPCCIMNLALCSRAFLVKERKTCMIYDHTALCFIDIISYNSQTYQALPWNIYFAFPPIHFGRLFQFVNALMLSNFCFIHNLNV